MTVIAETLDGQARAQRRNPREIHSLLGFGRGAADDHILDILRLKTFRARQRFFDRDRCEIVGARHAQRSLRGLAHGGPHRTYNDGFHHGDFLGLVFDPLLNQQMLPECRATHNPRMSDSRTPATVTSLVCLFAG